MDRSKDGFPVAASDRFFGRTSIVHLVSSYFHSGRQHRPALDAEGFKKCGKEMIDYIADYHQNLHRRRVVPDVEPGYLSKLLPSEAPENPEPFQAVMEDVERCIMPGITHWQHPRFHAYFPSGNSYPSLLADMLSDAIGCIGFSWAASPACAELETIVMDWYGKMIGLPDAFISTTPGGKGGGVIQTSASECIFVALLAARFEKIRSLKTKHPFVEEGMLLSKLVAYCSKEAHSSVEKAAMLGFVKLRILNTDSQYRLTGNELMKAILEDQYAGLIPFFAVATLGTTSCCSFDRLSEIGEVCSQEGIWLHVDAAYAGSAFICPEFREHLKGIEHATTMNTNPNKFLLTNFDASAMWVKDRYRLTQALVVDPLYLQHCQQHVSIDYRHWGIPLSRRFRSLKLWFVMRMYGVKGLQTYIREHVRLAKRFEELVKADPRFELVNDVILGLVCFRLKASNEINKRMLSTLNASGSMHMVPASLDNKFTVRFCVCAENACDRDIVLAWEMIQECAAMVLGWSNFAAWTVKMANGPGVISKLKKKDTAEETKQSDSDKDDDDFQDQDENETNSVHVLHGTWVWSRAIKGKCHYCKLKGKPLEQQSPFEDVKKKATAALRRSYFVRMVSDPKRYNPKIVRSLVGETRRLRMSADDGLDGVGKLKERLNIDQAVELEPVGIQSPI